MAEEQPDLSDESCIDGVRALTFGLSLAQLEQPKQRGGTLLLHDSAVMRWRC